MKTLEKTTRPKLSHSSRQRQLQPIDTTPTILGDTESRPKLPHSSRQHQLQTTNTTHTILGDTESRPKLPHSSRQRQLQPIDTTPTILGDTESRPKLPHSSRQRTLQPQARLHKSCLTLRVGFTRAHIPVQAPVRLYTHSPVHVCAWMPLAHM